MTIRRTHDPVWLLQRRLDHHRLLLPPGQIIDLLPIQIPMRPRPIGTLIIWIGEIDPPLRIDPQIVGAIHPMTTYIAQQYLHLSVRGDRPDLLLLVSTGDQPPIMIEIHSIRPPRTVHKKHQLLVNSIFPYLVTGLIRKKDISIPVYRRTLREGKLMRNRD